MGSASARLQAPRPHHYPPPRAPVSRGTPVPLTRVDMWALASGAAMGQGQAALARRSSPDHQRPHGPPASRQVSEARRPGDAPTRRGPEGSGTPMPMAPTHRRRAGPPRRRGAAAAEARAWCEAGVAAAGPVPPRGTPRPAAPVRPEQAPSALCRVRLARHARRAPRSVPQRLGRPGATAAKQDLRCCFIRTWPLENS